MKESIYKSQNGFCCVEGCVNEIDDFHHILHNTKANRKKYPLLMGSPFVLRGVCRHHHYEWTMHKEINSPYLNKLAEVYETYLRELKNGKNS